MIFSLKDMIDFLPPLLDGAVLTIAVSLLAFSLAMVSGLAIGIARISRMAPLRVVSACYIQFIRGTPLLLQLFFIYYVLPYAGIVLSPFVSGAIGLTLNYAAYMAEVFRSGIQAIPKGQWEAGSSVGMSRSLLMRRIILPQAARFIIPPLGNEFNAMLKNSTLVSVIGVQELLLTTETLTSATFRVFELYSIVALYFLTLTTAWGFVQGWIEAKFGKSGASRQEAPSLGRRLFGSLRLRMAR